LCIDDVSCVFRCFLWYFDAEQVEFALFHEMLWLTREAGLSSDFLFCLLEMVKGNQMAAQVEERGHEICPLE